VRDAGGVEGVDERREVAVGLDRPIGSNGVSVAADRELSQIAVEQMRGDVADRPLPGGRRPVPVVGRAPQNRQQFVEQRSKEMRDVARAKRFHHAMPSCSGKIAAGPGPCWSSARAFADRFAARVISSRSSCHSVSARQYVWRRFPWNALAQAAARYRERRGLVRIDWAARDVLLTSSEFDELESPRIQSFTTLAAQGNSFLPIMLPAGPETLTVAFVSPRFFETLGTKPVLGRLLAIGDAVGNAPPVALLSERVWRRAFNGNPDIRANGLIVGGRAFTTVGVTPDGFAAMTARLRTLAGGATATIRMCGSACVMHSCGRRPRNRRSLGCSSPAGCPTTRA
jgi:hypothetical protein